MANQALREKVLKAFEGIQARAGHAFSFALIYHRLWINLNPREKDEFNSEIEQMASENLLRIDGDLDTTDYRLVLTEGGYEKLYR